MNGKYLPSGIVFYQRSLSSLFSHFCFPNIEYSFTVVLRPVFIPGFAFHFGIDSAALGVGSEGTPEQKNMGFGADAVITHTGAEVSDDKVFVRSSWSW